MAMRYLRPFLLLTLLVALAMPFRASAQGLNSSGTEYWLSFMPNGTAGGGMYVDMHLFVVSTTNNRVSISVAGSVNSFTMTPNSVYDYSVSQAALTSQTETPTTNAIHVTSTNPVTIYGYSVWTCGGCIGGSPDGYLALPITSYGKKYYTMCFPDGTFGGTTEAVGAIIRSTGPIAAGGDTTCAIRSRRSRHTPSSSSRRIWLRPRARTSRRKSASR